MMKKGIYAILIALTVFALVLTGCPDPDPKTEQVTITFDAQGGTVSPATKKVDKGAEAGTLPVPTPALAEKEFGGWATKADATVSDFNKDTKVNSNITVYAIWKAGEGPGPGPGGPDYERAEKVTLDNAWYAVYTFVLPAGKEWQDYKGLKASFMMSADVLEKAPARGGRLMGPYQALDFTLYTGEGDAEGKDFWVANYNGGKNAEFIIDNTRGSGDWGGNAPGSLATALGAAGVTGVVGDGWFTLDYDITGTKGHSGFVKANVPAEGATGPFYFGVGLPGQDPDGEDLEGTVQYIRDVTLVGYEGVPDVIGTPTWFTKDGATLPVFTGYNSPNGTNGYKEAAREMADGSSPAPVDINPKDITLTVNLNYTGAPAPATKTVKSYTNLGTDLPTAEPQNNNTLASWNTKADGKGTTITATTQLTGNTTIFAIWAPPIEITLNLNYTGAPAPTKITIGKGQSLTAEQLTAEQDGFVLLGWNTKADGTGTAVTIATVLNEDATIFAQWAAKATADYVIPSLAIILDNPGGNATADPVVPPQAVKTGNTITVTDAYLDVGGTLTRQSGVDQIRFTIEQFPANWRSYEKLVVDYTLTFATSPTHPELGVGNQFKTEISYGKGSASGARINYFDLNGTNDPALEFTIANFPDTDGINIKCNPYGFAAGKTMQGQITLTINNVTFKAYE